jgi:peptidoglycan/LPS O-acetylase OafA/YrhL
VGSELSEVRPRVDRFQGLDGLRALAVLMVISHNYGPFPGLARFGRYSWFTAGYVGVTLFFVLSGFLITQRLIAEHRSTGAVSVVGFWKRRAYRLLPALMLCLLLLVINNIRTHVSTGETVRAFLSAVFYVFNLVSAQRTAANPLGSQGWGALWSLSVEEQFYVLWPVPLAWAWKRLKPRTALLSTGVLTAASAAWCTVLWLRHATFLRLYLVTDTRAQSLFLGAGMAIAWHGYPKIRELAKRASGFLGLACLGFVAAGVFGTSAAPTASPDWMLGPGVFAISVLCAFIVLIATEAAPSNLTRRLLNTKFAVAIGQRSYGLYLFHVVSAAYFRNVKGGWLLSAAVTFGLAWASYAFLEQPIMRWSRGRTSGHAASKHGLGSAKLREQGLVSELTGNSVDSPGVASEGHQ